MRYNRLSALRHECSDESVVRIIDTLSKLERDRDPWQSYCERNYHAVEIDFGASWVPRFQRLIGGGLFLEGLRRQRSITVAKARVLVLDAAISAIRRAHGQLPPDLQELKLASTLLIDPLAVHNAQFRYRLDGEQYYLASRAPDSELVMGQWSGWQLVLHMGVTASGGGGGREVGRQVPGRKPASC